MTVSQMYLAMHQVKEMKCYHKLLEKSNKTLSDLRASCAHRLAELICFITNRDVQNRCNLYQTTFKIILLILFEFHIIYFDHIHNSIPNSSQIQPL